MKEEPKDAALEEGLELAKQMTAWLTRNPRYFLNTTARQVKILSTVQHG